MACGQARTCCCCLVPGSVCQQQQHQYSVSRPEPAEDAEIDVPAGKIDLVSHVGGFLDSRFKGQCRCASHPGAGPPPLACRKMACAGGPPALVWGPPCLPSSLGGGGPGSSKDQPWCGFPPACLSSRWRLREQQGSGEAMGACGPPAGRGRDSALAGLFRSPPTLHTARLCGLCQPSGNGLYTLRGKGLPQLAGFCSWHATSR